MSQSYIDRQDLYRHNDTPLGIERTKKRLTEMAELGMEEVGVAEFGITNVMGGLYIERVWRYNDEQWNKYMDWVRTLKMEKQPIIDAARKRAVEKIRTLAANGDDVLSGGYDHKDDIAHTRLAIDSYGTHHLFYSEVREGYWRFVVTEEELGIQKHES